MPSGISGTKYVKVGYKMQLKRRNRILFPDDFEQSKYSEVIIERKWSKKWIRVTLAIQ